jgi:hypothetical protein
MESSNRTRLYLFNPSERLNFQGRLIIGGIFSVGEKSLYRFLTSILTKKRLKKRYRLLTAVG